MSEEKHWATGQRFAWTWADGTGSGAAIVAATWSDKQMGLSPEADQYVARWMKANPVDPAAEKAAPSREALTFVLGTDERIYLDGKDVFLKAI